MRRLLALALTVTLVAAGLLAYYRMGPLPLRLDRAPAGDSHVLETLVNPGEGLVVRHPLGAQLNVPPQTFDRPTRVRVAPEEVVPLSHSLAAPVWSLEADGAEFARPVELVLSLLPDASSGETVETFAVFWDGHHWSRTPGLARADGSAVYVQATHFSLWSAGQDPVTLGDNHDTIPSILRLNVPERVEAGQEVEIGYAVANLGGSDLDGYGEVTVSITGAGGETQVSGGRVEGWDGTDGPLGSVAYVAGMDLAEPLSGISVVDAESLAPLRVPALTPGPARVQVRLDFYDRAGQPLSSAVAEQTITVSGSEPAGQVEP